MVGLAETAERDRHEGDAAAAVLPEPQKCPPSCEATPSSEAYPIKALSSTHFRLFRVLQEQLIAQLTANSKGGDIDPRRRPPHAATPQGILIRWLTANPKRLRGSYLSRGLRAHCISSAGPESEELGRPSSAPNGNRARQSPQPAVCQAGPRPPKHVSSRRHYNAVTPAAAAADTPLRNKSDPSSGSSTSADTEEGEAHENHKLVRPASPEEGSSAEISRKLAATPGVPSTNLIDCAVCLVPFKPIGGGILCTSCLLRLGSTQVTLVAPSDGLRTKRGFAGEASQADQEKKGALREKDDPRSVGFDQGHADRRMPKRRRFKSAASAVDATLQQQEQQDQQQQQQESTEAVSDGGVRREEEPGWRARATAAAAASAGESSWWCPFEAAGEAPVVPPLLLPLLPSIFSLHARHWPPPPAKRRRFLSRRRRGLFCLTPAASWEGTQLGAPQSASWDAAEPEGQEGSKTLEGNAATAEPTTEVAPVGDADMQGATAVRGISAEGKAAPEAAAGREITLAQKTAAKSLDAGGTYTPISSTSCIGPLCCPATSGKPEGSSPCGAACSCVIGAPTAKTSKDGLCFSPAASPLAYAHETLPRRRRGRLSEPTGTTSTAAAANLSDDSAVREIAAAAAAVATLKTEEQQREQQTPPSRLRRSCGSDVGRCTVATAAPAAEGKPHVQPGSSTPSTGSNSNITSEAAAAGGPTVAAGSTVEVFVGAGAPAAMEAAAASAGPPISSPSSYSPSQDSESGSPVGALPSAPPRHGSLARISQGLIVGRSSLGRGSGLGIYSCRDFSRRALVCEYSGVLIDRGTALLLRRMRCASHVINVQMQHLYLLGFHTPCPLLGGGAFVNDGRWRTGGGDGPGVSVRFRVMFDRYRAAQRVMIVAMKDIKKGDELLTSYDNDYWRLMAQTSQGKQK